jgi:RecA-family ATPase
MNTASAIPSAAPWTEADSALGRLSLDVRRAPEADRLKVLRAGALALRRYLDEGFLIPADVENEIYAIANDLEMGGAPGSAAEIEVYTIARDVTLPPEFRSEEEPPPPHGPEAYGLPINAVPDQAPPPAPEILPFETFDASQWEGVPIDTRRWIAHNRIPVGEPGIMSGDGGTGKTKLALQLAAAIPAGLRDWVGGVVDAEGQVIVFSAEEKLKEMHRRTSDVIEHRGLSFRDLAGGLHFICDTENPVLGAVDRNGVVQPTMSLWRLEKTVAAIRPALVIIENAADVYAGNESDRPNVTRFMRGLLGRLTVPCESTVMLIQHPSVSGLNDGTGRSGSTGWNNSGRWRCNFTKVKDSDDLRQLEIVKNNYGPTGEKVSLRWERGVFVPENTAAASPYRAAAETQVDELFLRLLDKFSAQGRDVRSTTGSGYAPAEFEDDPEAKAAEVKAKALKAAMARLFEAGKIITVQGKRSKHIERAAQ